MRRAATWWSRSPHLCGGHGGLTCSGGGNEQIFRNSFSVNIFKCQLDCRVHLVRWVDGGVYSSNNRTTLHKCFNALDYQSTVRTADWCCHGFVWNQYSHTVGEISIEDDASRVPGHADSQRLVWGHVGGAKKQADEVHNLIEVFFLHVVSPRCGCPRAGRLVMLLVGSHPRRNESGSSHVQLSLT